MRKIATLLVCTALVMPSVGTAAETRLKTYEFNGANGTTPAGWEADGNGRVFGQGVVRSMGSHNGSGLLNVAVETYDSSGKFREESMRTTDRWAPSAGNRTYITVRARVRINHTRTGIVHGLFMYTDWTENGRKHQDELDFEWLTKKSGPTNPDTVNVSSWKRWNVNAGYNQPYNSTYGMQLSESVASGVNTESFHKYEMKWYPDKLEFYVDDSLRRRITNTNLIPTRAMPVFLNSWVPNSDWTDAYVAGLTPTNRANNKVYNMQVDWLTVDRGTY